MATKATLLDDEMATLEAASIRASLMTRRIAWPTPVGRFGVPVLVALLVSWQVTLRSEDPNGVAYQGVTSVINGTGGDLSQYRILSAYLAFGIQQLMGAGAPPFQAIRFVQMSLISALVYAYYGQLRVAPFVRVVGIALLGGLISLSMGVIGPSTFSLDRFSDVIFYLVAALLVLRGREAWIPPLMVLAVANRETAVFIPTLILARYRPWASRPLFRLASGAEPRTPDDWGGPQTPGAKRSRWRAGGGLQPVAISAIAWAVAAVVYVAIHAYYGPRPRVEESYWGTAMVLRSLAMPGQTAYFFAAINLIPALCLLGMKDVDPFLKRLFWMVVPVWFAIHIWAARLGEGIMYLAPTALILVPMLLQALERAPVEPAPARAE